MKILLTSINFYPDHAGIAVYSTDLCRYLAERDHRVTVVTGFPYYPCWKKSPQDAAALFRKESRFGARVLRGFLYVPSRPTTVRRGLHDLSFSVFAALNFLRAGRHSIVIVLSPPMLLTLVALCFARLWSARLVIHIQDLQLDAAINLSMLKAGYLIRILRWLEAFLYRRADLVVPISEGMAQLVAAKGVPSERMLVAYNWIDLHDASSPPASDFRARHGLSSDQFVVAYAGNLGVKQGIHTLLELAQLTIQDDTLRYFVVGDGADRQRLVDHARAHHLRNVTFLPLLPENEYQAMLDGIDLAFLAQRAGAGEVFFPSKLLGILLRGRPVLVSADPTSEVARFTTKAGCGFVSPWGDAGALRDQVEYLRRNPDTLRAAGAAGKQAIVSFDRERILGDFHRRLETIAAAS